MDIKDVLKRKIASTEVAWILMDPTLQDRRDELDTELSAARIYDKRHTDAVKRADEVEKKIDDVDLEIAESRVPFKFASIGRENYSKLIDENKPREGNTMDQDVGFNADEFPPRLLALSAVDPKMDLDDARQIWDGGEGQWSDGETTKLLLTAIKANKEVVDVPFTRLGSRMETLSIGTELPIPETSESHTQSS